MKRHELISSIMFDYEEYSREQIVELCQPLPRKLLRWLGIHHPDNRTRKIFYEMTNVEIGEGTVINQNFIVSDNYEPLLKIGKRVAIAPNVTVICVSEPNNSLLKEYACVQSKLIRAEPVIIEDDVWIGAHVTLLPGIRIGEKSIIGAGSVVHKDIPPKSIAAGVPAKVLRKIEE